MLGKRLLSALIPLPFILLLIHLGPTWGWGLFIALCAGIALYEYLVITRATSTLAERIPLLAVGLAAFWGFHSLPIVYVLLIVVGLFLFSYLWVLARPGDMANSFSRASAIFFGYVYVPLLLSFLVRVHALPMGRNWVYISLAIAWCGDTIAYFAGRFLGRHKLYPVISPGKTWEGAVGGLLGSFLGVLTLKLILFPELTVLGCAVIAIPGGILGQLGDLCESMLKRAVGVKDSGTIMPGHGGILDRIDALVFLLPYTFACALLLFPERVI